MSGTDGYSLHVSLDQIVELVRPGAACILTGAGISTESGIPDYRGPDRCERRTRPVTYREFVSSATARRSYWARSAIGWPWLAQRQPNVGHAVVAAIEHAGLCTGTITQNVDGLHAAAGSGRVIELHGALRSVICLACRWRESRAGLQERILVQNPDWMRHSGEITPDGDVDLDPQVIEPFRIPACLRCGGMIKPDIVFFGENVPSPRVDEAFELLDRSRMLLVLGSSLTVYSGYRFVAAALKQKKPVVIITDGPTRADAIATIKSRSRLGVTLSSIAEALDLSGGPVQGGPSRVTHATGSRDARQERARRGLDGR